MSELDATIEELKRLHEAFLTSYRPITEDQPEYDRLCGALAQAFPAILAEREQMRAKLEAAQRLRDATSKLIEQGDLQTVRLFKDFGQLIDEKYADASNKAIDALAAFDQEQP